MKNKSKNTTTKHIVKKYKQERLSKKMQRALLAAADAMDRCSNELLESVENMEIQRRLLEDLALAGE